MTGRAFWIGLFVACSIGAGSLKYSEPGPGRNCSKISGAQQISYLVHKKFDARDFLCA